MDIRQDLLAAGPTVPLWPTAGNAVGASRSTTYALAQRGEFPAKVLRLGSSYRVVTADLLALLRIENTAA
ncbi:DNA-binding protein [Rhodococcus sp. 1168]|uniref:DNA-binding protein n=1 Tax=Rhodococcus sp. 1168 TaxID=2018041 RepID=UPI000A0C79CB|nr:DNA-binding protein [Rhodococcus sp. 1168]ORI15796.1 hypothetical protein BJI47_01470 [Rhodococcus sp. 1168]